MNNETEKTQAVVPLTPTVEDRPIAVRTIGVFENDAAFRHAQRVAKMLCLSALMPEHFRGEENLGSVVIVMDIAARLKLNPLLVAQQIYLVYGKPGYSAQFVIAVMNTNADFGKLRYEMTDHGEKTFEYNYTEGFGQNKQRKTGKATLHDIECVAWALEGKDKLPEGINTLAKAKEAGLAILEGPPVSMSMAFKEGWYAKDGSKWQTLPDLMLRYRAASFFGRLFAPELMMGLPTVDELEDRGPEETVVRPIFESKVVAETPKTPPAAKPAVEESTNTPQTAQSGTHPPATPPEAIQTPIQRQETSGLNPLKAVRGLLKSEKIEEKLLIDFLHAIDSVPDGMSSLEEIHLNNNTTLQMVCDQWSDVVKRLREVAKSKGVEK